MMHALRHITTLWSVRREPECDRLLMKSIWKVALGCMSIWLIVAAALGTYITLQKESSSSETTDTQPQSVLSAKQLEIVIGAYEAREVAHEEVANGTAPQW